MVQWLEFQNLDASMAGDLVMYVHRLNISKLFGDWLSIKKNINNNLMLLINEFRGLFASCNSINMNINAIYYFTKRSLLTTPLKSFLVCLFSFLHDYKKCNLLSSLEFSVAFCVRIQTTLTDFLSSFSVLVLYQYILVYNYFVSCPFICGHISILAFSFM